MRTNKRLVAGRTFLFWLKYIFGSVLFNCFVLTDFYLNCKFGLLILRLELHSDLGEIIFRKLGEYFMMRVDSVEVLIGCFVDGGRL